MRLSFVIPTRNQAPYIRRCLDSCIAQHLEDSEIVVVDGLSTDGTQRILASYGDAVRWTSERDAGQGDAVNKGVRSATGDVIAWINSDDYYYDSQCVSEALARFNDPEVDLVYGRALVVDSDGVILRPYVDRTFKNPADLLASAIGPPQPAVLFRKSVFSSVGGLRADLHYALDYDLMLRLFSAARRCEKLDRIVACMRFHRDAKSISAMLPQIREAVGIKRVHSRRMRLTLANKLRLWTGIASLYTYWAAVRLRLRRAL